MIFLKIKVKWPPKATEKQLLRRLLPSHSLFLLLRPSLSPKPSSTYPTASVFARNVGKLNMHRKNSGLKRSTKLPAQTTPYLGTTVINMGEKGSTLSNNKVAAED